ncbi:Hypothetical protein P9515_13861 [Prochlorococcus marinus str. MIT 9515]|uniref:non-specific protein-tyrosine kinase n=1 Tax=Prochlorococcus marinus (strain MIT 9515) TaxID=167542 RepID=A2BXT2_PROM5|nr:tyrosine-protein kinase family protein [Prochlorococcus marinus]ABM72593.1 Hypothetical protein P9515_13861 [Prochlorococcus marinus str. MIT 9515]
MNNTSKNNSNEEINPSQILNNNESEEKTSLEFLLDLILRRKKIFLLTLIIFSSFSLIRTTREKIYNPIYKGEFSILIKDPIKQASSIAGSSEGMLLAKNFMGATNTDLEQDIPTLRELLLSELVLYDISKKYKLDTKSLSQRINIKRDPRAKGILEFSLTSKDPKKDKLLLEDLSDLYVNYASLRTQKKLSSGLAFLSNQEPAIKIKNSQLLEKLENFRRKNNYVDPINQGDSLKVDINEINQDITQLQRNIERLKNVKEDIAKGKVDSSSYRELVGDSKRGAATVEITNPEEKLNLQVKELNEQLGNALRVYTPNSSVVRNIKARLDQLKPKVKEKQLRGVDIAIQSAQDNIKLKKSTLSDLNSKFDNLLTEINDYSEIIFELESSTANLGGIISAKEQLQLELAQDSSPWTVIKPPTFLAARIYPSYSQELSKSLLIAIFVGLGLALLRDKFDNVYHSAEEVRNELKYPFLGHVPYVDYFSDIREEQKSIINDISLINNNENIESYDRFFYQESLRNIYTSLRFLNSDNPIKVITMTSSIPKEGKSLINILLSKTLSEMDLKILQIDADLRRPQIHSRLGLNNLTGLSNILTNPSLTLEDVIQSVPGFKNWDVITSGTKPPDPTRLLNSEKMRTFIKDIKESDKYDLIVFDTPPVIGLADSLLVSEKSDGLILLVSTNSVNKSLPKESISRSIKSGTHFLGIITNAIKKESKNVLKNGYEDYAYAAYSTYGIDLNNENSEKTEQISNLNDNDQFNKLKELIFKNLRIIFDKSMKWLDD